VAATREYVLGPALPQPRIEVGIMLYNQQYPCLVYQTAKRGGRAYMEALADTGCQSSVMLGRVLQKMGLKTRYLTSTNYRMNRINGTPIHILGCIFAWIF
jgi:uncharacterized protein (UPF0261 family)